MDKPPKDPRVFVNGIDLSGYITDITFDAPANPAYAVAARTLYGFPLKEIAISGFFDTDLTACGICGQSFVPGAEGTPGRRSSLTPRSTIRSRRVRTASCR